MSKLAAALLLLAAVPAWSAEVPQRLADVNRNPAQSSGDLYEPEGFFELGGRLFFSTAGVLSFDEGILWSTDGSPESLDVVSSKICPSPCQAITPVAKLGDTVLLRTTQGFDYPVSFRYWRTDGTPSGTFPLTGNLEDVRDETLVPGSPSSSSPNFSPNNGLFYFVVYGSDDTEIWRSDGTVAGTFPLKDPDEGPFIRYPGSLTAWGGRLYFLAEEHQEGSETDRLGLWSTDGTPRGTRFFHEVGSYSRLVATPSRLFFTSGEVGEELWTTDGTPGGTRFLHEFEPRFCSGGDPDDCPDPGINSLVAVGDAVYFVIPAADNRYEVWESDGTPGGTRSLALFPAGVYPFYDTLYRIAGRWVFLVLQRGDFSIWTAGDQLSHAAPLTGCEGGSCPDVQSAFVGSNPDHLLFTAEDPAHGIELWTTDGTAAGTRRLSDVCPGPCDGLLYDLRSEGVRGTFQNQTWFIAYPESTTQFSHSELWVTDGTPGGTRRVAGPTRALGFLGGTAYFGRVGPGETGGSAAELWAAGGSPHRIAVLKRSAPGSFPTNMPLPNGGALLAIYDGRHQQLWRSDGTPGGTRPLTVAPPPDNHVPFCAGSLYFFPVRRSGSGGSVLHEIWRTDGTDRGTHRLADLAPGTYVDLQAIWNGNYLFLVGGSQGCAFWTSDGTRAGTAERVPMPRGVRCPTGLHPFGSQFLFVARVEQDGGDLVPQLFASDGTLAGTRQITQLRGDRGSLGTEFAQIGGVAFFRIYDRFSLGTEIWRTDGTRKGTRPAFPGLLYPSIMQAFRGALYFIAYAHPGGLPILFRATPDGAPPGRLAFASFDYAYSDFFFGELPFTPAGNRLFFTFQDDKAGLELWVTDGTPAGTKRVRDIQPGPGSSFPEGLTAAGDRVYFAAADGEHGRELWVSDGTVAGTRMVWDLNPGGFSSNPESLAVSGGNLFFGADDGETGQEPRVLRLTPP